MPRSLLGRMPQRRSPRSSPRWRGDMVAMPHGGRLAPGGRGDGPWRERGGLWLNGVSCIRLRPEYPGHVWSYDVVEVRTRDGRKYRILSIIDEARRECLALPVARKLKSDDVLAALAELFVTRGPPAHIR